MISESIFTFLFVGFVGGDSPLYMVNIGELQTNFLVQLGNHKNTLNANKEAVYAKNVSLQHQSEQAFVGTEMPLEVQGQLESLEGSAHAPASPPHN